MQQSSVIRLFLGVLLPHTKEHRLPIMVMPQGLATNQDDGREYWYILYILWRLFVRIHVAWRFSLSTSEQECQSYPLTVIPEL